MALAVWLYFWLWHKAVRALVEDSYDTLAAELLDRILAQPPMFLETLSLKLLQAMGYGGRESLLEHTGSREIAASTGWSANMLLELAQRLHTQQTRHENSYRPAYSAKHDRTRGRVSR